MDIKKIKLLCLILGISLAVNLVFGLFLYKRNKEYLFNYKLNSNPDAHHYVLLGNNFWEKGVYSRQDGPPYMPDVLRTPVYPLIAGGIQYYFKTIWPLYMLQVILTTLSAFIIFAICSEVFHYKAGFWAALFYGLDPLVLVYNFKAMSEIVFMFFLLCSIYYFIKFLKPFLYKQTLLYIFLSAFFMAMAILTRPAALYLPIVLVFLALIIHYKKIRLLIKFIFVYIFIIVLLLTPWVVRNYHIYGIKKLTIVDSIGLLYCAAAGVYQLKYNVSREKAVKLIEQKYGVPSHTEAHNFWISKYSVKNLKDMDMLLKKVAIKIILNNPFYFLKSSLAGLIKATISHNLEDFAYLFNVTWHHPQLSLIKSLHFKEFFRNLFLNNLALTFVFFYQILFQAIILFFFFVGLFFLFTNYKENSSGFIILGVIYYFIFTVFIMGLDAYSKYRFPLMPFVFIIGSYGITSLFSNLFRKAKIA